jgi:putative transposase
MTQGKIERYHLSMKNLVLLQNYVYPWDLEREIARFVDYYDHQRYHESLDDVTPPDIYLGRTKEDQSRREEIKRTTLEARRRQHTQMLRAAA